MNIDFPHVAALLHIANESAKHGPALSGIHTEAMDELKKIHDELTKERVERGKAEAAEAAEKEAKRVAKAKIEEEEAQAAVERSQPRAVPNIIPEPESESVDRRGV